jgi:hypothetical protein
MAAASQAAAQVSGASIDVRIDSVLATNTNQGVDARLTPISRQLKQMFNYSTFQLVSHEERHASLGHTVDFTLPGGRFMHVDPRACDENRVELSVVLFQGERPTMTTDLKMRNGALLLLAGPRYEQGMLIVSMFVRALRKGTLPVIPSPVIPGTP